MKIKKIPQNKVALHGNTKVKLKTSGTMEQILFVAGNNTVCPIHNLSKEEYLDKSTDISDGLKEFKRITVAEP